MSKKNYLSRRLELLFNDLKIKKNDNILIHSNSAGLSQFNYLKKNLYIKFLNFLLNKIGKKGTILIPTYNYDFTIKKVFDKKKTDSQVGSFGNFLLKRHFKNRSDEPIFNHLIFGKLKKKLMQSNTKEAFGQDSIFAKLEKFKFKILCFCCSPSNITFFHYIEKKFNVKYRYDKIFKGYILKNNNILNFSLKYFVGKKKYNYNIKEHKVLKLLDNHEFIEKKFGKFLCYSVNCVYLIKVLKKKLKNNKNFLIK